jgi:rhodanese-related sulfurtransferase
MRSASVIILFAFVAEANATESKDKLADELVDRLVNHLFSRVLGQSTMTNAMKAPSLMHPLRSSGMANTLSQQVPHGTPFGLTPKIRGAVVTRAKDPEYQFHYKPLDFNYEEVPPAEVQQMIDQGWVLLDVREPDQVERAAIRGADEVPLYVLKNDFSPFGIYQELASFGMGGWWMGGRPMKENHNFVREVESKIGKGAPGIIAVCQSGLRSKQALKELHLAGYSRLALVKGGLNRVRHNELPCEVEGCRLDLAGSGNVAGVLQWHVH